MNASPVTRPNPLDILGMNTDVITILYESKDLAAVRRLAERLAKAYLTVLHPDIRPESEVLAGEILACLEDLGTDEEAGWCCRERLHDPEDPAVQRLQNALISISTLHRELDDEEEITYWLLDACSTVNQFEILGIDHPVALLTGDQCRYNIDASSPTSAVMTRIAGPNGPFGATCQRRVKIEQVSSSEN